MKSDMFTFIAHAEDEHWWFSARADILLEVLGQCTHSIDKLLDIGCGTGYFLSKAKSIAKDLYGVDPATYETTRFNDIVNGTIEDIPLESDTFDCVTCLDVLEHIKDPTLGLNEIKRVLKPGGIAVITVPACQFLYGPHDLANDHYRRFSRKSFTDLVDDDFEIVKSTYFNSLLFPIEAGVRLLERLTRRCITNGTSDNSLVNKLFFKIFDSEKIWLRKHTYCMGISYLAVLRKNST